MGTRPGARRRSAAGLLIVLVATLVGCGSSAPRAARGPSWTDLPPTPYRWPTAGVALSAIAATAADATTRPTDTSCAGTTSPPEIVLASVVHTETSSPALGQRVWLLGCASSDASSPPGAESVTLFDAGAGSYVVGFSAVRTAGVGPTVVPSSAAGETHRLAAHYTPDEAGSCCPWTMDPPAGARPHTSLDRVLIHTEGSDGGFRPNVIAAFGLFDGSVPDGQTADGYVPPQKAVAGVPAWLIVESPVLIASSCPGSSAANGVNRCGRVIGWRQRVIADSDERALSPDEWSSGPPPAIP